MNKIIYKSIILCTAAICFHNLNAQTAAKDTLLNRQVLLEREYTPTIQDASKIDKMPALHEPQRKQYDIRFEENTPTIFLSSFQVTEIGSSDILTAITKSKQRGYFDFRAGMYSNVTVNGGYRIVEKTNQQLDIFGYHNSTNGNIDYLEKTEGLDKIKAKNMENFIKAQYKYDFESAKWYLNTSFLNNGFNYYGNPYLIQDKTDLAHKIENLTKNQEINIFGVETGLESAQKEDSFGYQASIRYNRFTSKYNSNISYDGPKGNILDAKVNLSKPFQFDKRIGIKGSLFYQKYDEHKNMYIEGSNDQTYHNLTIVRANPYIKFENGDFDLLLGANANWAMDRSNSFLVAPTINAKWTFNDNNVVYLDVDGGINDNSFISIYKENKYMKPMGRVSTSKTLYDAQLGIRSGAIAGLEFDIFGGYKYTKNQHLFVPATAFSWGNISDVLYGDIGQGNIGASVKTKLIPYTDLSLKAVSHFYNLKNDESFAKKAWGLPTFTFNLGADFSFIDNLIISANYELSGGRKTLINGNSVSMKNINELNVKAGYHILDWITFYVKVNNLLNQKYERYYGYTLQGVAASAGFNLTF